jgi:hypothetical protein
MSSGEDWLKSWVAFAKPVFVSHLDSLYEGKPLIQQLRDNSNRINALHETEVQKVFNKLFPSPLYGADKLEMAEQLVNNPLCGPFCEFFNYFIEIGPKYSKYIDSGFEAQQKRRNGLVPIVVKLYEICKQQGGSRRKSRGRRRSSPTRRKKSKSRRTGRKSPRTRRR